MPVQLNRLSATVCCRVGRAAASALSIPRERRIASFRRRRRPPGTAALVAMRCPSSLYLLTAKASSSSSIPSLQVTSALCSCEAICIERVALMHAARSISPLNFIIHGDWLKNWTVTERCDDAIFSRNRSIPLLATPIPRISFWFSRLRLFRQTAVPPAEPVHASPISRSALLISSFESESGCLPDLTIR